MHHQTNKESETLQEVICTQKTETTSLSLRVKGLQQELGLLKERDGTYKAQQRLLNLSQSVHTSVSSSLSPKATDYINTQNDKNVNSKNKNNNNTTTNFKFNDSKQDNNDDFKLKNVERKTSKDKDKDIADTFYDKTDMQQWSLPIPSSTPLKKSHYTLPLSDKISSAVIAHNSRNSGSNTKSITRMNTRVKNRKSLSVERGMSSSSSMIRSGSWGEDKEKIKETAVNHSFNSMYSEHHQQQEDFIHKDADYFTTHSINVRSPLVPPNLIKSPLSLDLRPPLPSSASLYFSDSEIQHYQRHSTSSFSPFSSFSSFSGQSNKIDQEPNANMRTREIQLQKVAVPQQSSSEYRGNEEVATTSSSKSVDDRLSNNSSSVMGIAALWAANENIRASADRKDNVGNEDKNRNNNSCSSSGSNYSSIRDMAKVEEESFKGSSDPQKQHGYPFGNISKVSEKWERNIIATTNNSTAADSIAQQQRLDRLQKMYERVTGREGKKLVLRDSDSSDSD